MFANVLVPVKLRLVALQDLQVLFLRDCFVSVGEEEVPIEGKPYHYFLGVETLLSLEKSLKGLFDPGDWCDLTDSLLRLTYWFSM